MTVLNPSVTRVIDSYRDAVFAKDAAAFLRLYDPGVRVFDAWGVWTYEGAEAWRGAVEGWLGSLDDECVEVTFDDVRISAGQDMAVVSAIVTYAGISAQGERLRAMQNRLTWMLQNRDGELRIIHEHTSAPIGFEDQKAILRR